MPACLVCGGGHQQHPALLDLESVFSQLVDSSFLTLSESFERVKFLRMGSSVSLSGEGFFVDVTLIQRTGSGPASIQVLVEGYGSSCSSFELSEVDGEGAVEGFLGSVGEAVGLLGD